MATENITDDTTENTTNIPSLPKVEFSVSLQEIGFIRSNGQLFGKSINVDVLIELIPATAIQATVERTFTEIQASAAANLNGIQRPPLSSPLDILSKPVDNGQTKISVSVDKSGTVPTVNVKLSAVNVREEYLSQLLNSHKQYITNVVLNELTI